LTQVCKHEWSYFGLAKESCDCDKHEQCGQQFRRCDVCGITEQLSTQLNKYGAAG